MLHELMKSVVFPVKKTVEFLESIAIVLCRLVVRVHCQPHCTKQYSVVQCRVFSPQNMHFPIVWCAVYIHFAACSLTTNLQSTIQVGLLICSKKSAESSTPGDSAEWNLTTMYFPNMFVGELSKFYRIFATEKTQDRSLFGRSSRAVGIYNNSLDHSSTALSQQFQTGWRNHVAKILQTPVLGGKGTKLFVEAWKFN